MGRPHDGRQAGKRDVSRGGRAAPACARDDEREAVVIDILVLILLVIVFLMPVYALAMLFGAAFEMLKGDE